MLDAALDQLPGTVQAGHREGDEASLVERPVVCRTDSAGSTAGFVAALASRNIGFFTVAATNSQIQAAIFDAEGVEGSGNPPGTETARRVIGTATGDPGRRDGSHRGFEVGRPSSAASGGVG